MQACERAQYTANQRRDERIDDADESIAQIIDTYMYHSTSSFKPPVCCDLEKEAFSRVSFLRGTFQTAAHPSTETTVLQFHLFATRRRQSGAADLYGACSETPEGFGAKSGVGVISETEERSSDESGGSRQRF